jgi:hypothetical protein
LKPKKRPPAPKPKRTSHDRWEAGFRFNLTTAQKVACRAALAAALRDAATGFRGVVIAQVGDESQDPVNVRGAFIDYETARKLNKILRAGLGKADEA